MSEEHKQESPEMNNLKEGETNSTVGSVRKPSPMDALWIGLHHFEAGIESRKEMLL